MLGTCGSRTRLKFPLAYWQLRQTALCWKGSQAQEQQGPVAFYADILPRDSGVDTGPRRNLLLLWTAFLRVSSKCVRILARP